MTDDTPLYAQTQLPVVNPNGTSRTELVSQKLDASVAVRTAAIALREGPPHGRDYPDTAAFAKAQGIHLHRLSTLREIERALEAEALEIHRGGE